LSCNKSEVRSTAEKCDNLQNMEICDRCGRHGFSRNLVKCQNIVIGPWPRLDAAGVISFLSVHRRPLPSGIFAPRSRGARGSLRKGVPAAALASSKNQPAARPRGTVNQAAEALGSGRLAYNRVYFYIRVPEKLLQHFADNITLCDAFKPKFAPFLGVRFLVHVPAKPLHFQSYFFQPLDRQDLHVNLSHFSGPPFLNKAGALTAPACDHRRGSVGRADCL
jgi:hypothetical protein